MDDRTAVNSTLKSLKFPASATSESPSDSSAPSGLIGRLVEKEKQVTALKAELDALQAVKPGDRTVCFAKTIKVQPADDAYLQHDEGKKDRAERNRQWTNLMDEITANKAQIAELEASLDARDKENKYLKRTLESVYTRFQVSNSTSQSSDGADQPPPKVKTEVLGLGTLEAIAKRDEQIQALKEELEKAKRSATQAIPILNSAFPANFKAARPAPKPPSPAAAPIQGDPANSIATQGILSGATTPSTAAKPAAALQIPPPPPPPPALIPQAARASNTRNAPSPPAPPPPPPAKFPPAPPVPPPPPLARLSSCATHQPSTGAAAAGVPPPPPPPPLTPRAKRIKPGELDTPRIQVHRSTSSVVSPRSKLKVSSSSEEHRTNAEHCAALFLE